MSDLLELTAAAGGRRASARASSTPGEYFDFYRERAAADDLNSYIWVADGRRPSVDRGRAARRRPDRDQGPLLHRGRPEPGRLEDPRGLPPAVHRDGVANAPRRPARTLLGKTNQDEFAMGSSTENSAYGPTLNPWDTHARPRRLSGRLAPPPSPPAPPRGRSAPTPAARSASPPRCAGSSASSPPTARSRRYGMIAFASSLDQAGPFTRDVTDARAAARRDGRRGPVRLAPRSACPSRSTLPTATDLEGHPPRRARGARPARGSSPACWRPSRRRSSSPRELGATVETMQPAARAARARRLLPDRARRGVLQPRPLRRRPLRLPRRRRTAACWRMYTADARAGLRRRGQAPHHARHLRAVLAATTTPTTAARRRSAR